MLYHILILIIVCCSGVSSLNIRKLPASVGRCRRATPSVLNLVQAPPVDVDPILLHQPVAEVNTRQNLPALYHGDKQISFGIPADLLQRQVLYSKTLASPTVLLTANQDEAISFTSPEQAGKWFFVLYVAVSFAAGFKELGVRFQTWLQNRNEENKGQ